MKKWLVKCGMLAFIIMLTFVACGNENSENPSDEDNGYDDISENPQDTRERADLHDLVTREVTVARVNGIEMTAKDISMMIREAQIMLQTEMFEMTPEEWEIKVLEEAVRISAISFIFAEYAEQMDVFLTAIDEAELRESISAIEEMYGDMLEELLFSDNIFGVEHLMHFFRGFMLADKVVHTIVSDPTLFAPFEQYMEEEVVLDEELFAAKHILVMNDNFSGLERGDDEVERIANEIWERIQDGEDFDYLMFEYSEDTGLFMHPEGYTFTSGAMVTEFEEATRELQIGEISEPIVAFHGIHIIKRIEPSDNPADIMRPWGIHVPTLEERMENAVYSAFQIKIENAEFEFLPTLYTIPVM
ncbi:MAG: peptidylprolyl isomerase [Defluviitaleaceae bacterium]|nr:peptidylprolyl isomerase [Defluviitaleaceae bacterium]